MCALCTRIKYRKENKNDEEKKTITYMFQVILSWFLSTKANLKVK